MAGKAGLANTLLGKFVAVIWGLDHIFDLPRQFKGMPSSGFRSSGKVDSPAKIEAAWTEQGAVRLAVVDNKGRTDVLYFTNVKVFPTEASANEYMQAYTFRVSKRDAILELICNNPTMKAEEKQNLISQVEGLEKELREL